MVFTGSFSIVFNRAESRKFPWNFGHCVYFANQFHDPTDVFWLGDLFYGKGTGINEPGDKIALRSYHVDNFRSNS
jgi:hypothetical protein